MKVAVIGASGRTGRIVVKDALARGHQVVAVTRSDGASARDDDNLVNAAPDVRDAEALKRALVGADTVISVLGVKLAVISAVPAGPWEEQPLLQRRIALPILQRFFGASYDDMRRMETILQET